jgi:Escherichia/Staphylococcus phage prohead protease
MSDYEIRSLAEAPTINSRGTSGSGSNVIVGYAAVFNSPSQEMSIRGTEPNGRKFREVVLPGAFTQSLAERRAVFAFFQHNDTQVLGSTANGTLRLSEDSRGLRYEIDPPDTQAGRDIVELIRRGDVRGSSFGFKVRSGGQTMRRNGDHFVRELRSLELLDVSPVTAGAYPAASVDLQRSGQAGFMQMRLQLAEAAV